MNLLESMFPSSVDAEFLHVVCPLRLGVYIPTAVPFDGEQMKMHQLANPNLITNLKISCVQQLAMHVAATHGHVSLPLMKIDE